MDGERDGGGANRIVVKEEGERREEKCVCVGSRVEKRAPSRSDEHRNPVSGGLPHSQHHTAGCERLMELFLKHCRKITERSLHHESRGHTSLNPDQIQTRSIRNITFTDAEEQRFRIMTSVSTQCFLTV